MNIHSVVTAKPARRTARPRTRAAAEEPADRHDAILLAALELFVERGFYGVAVPEIAERAKVGAGTIYRHFDSKEALVNALYRREKMRFLHISTTVQAASGGRELFRALWQHMAGFVMANRAAFTFLELHHHAAYLDGESRALEQRSLDLFAKLVVAAQRRGELKDMPPNLLMAIVMGAFTGIVRNCSERDRELTAAEWKLAEQCVWEAIRA
jgi:TetR/AcrR family transcriptional regulator, repressor of fatR-cypB operon